MGLRLVDFVVLPAETLLLVSLQSLTDREWDGAAHLRDAKGAPLLLPEKLQRALALVMVPLRDRLQHSLGKLHVPVLKLAVRVTR